MVRVSSHRVHEICEASFSTSILKLELYLKSTEANIRAYISEDTGYRDDLL